MCKSTAGAADSQWASQGLANTDLLINQSPLCCLGLDGGYAYLRSGSGNSRWKQQSVKYGKLASQHHCVSHQYGTKYHGELWAFQHFQPVQELAFALPCLELAVREHAQTTSNTKSNTIMLFNAADYMCLRICCGFKPTSFASARSTINWLEQREADWINSDLCVAMNSKSRRG